MTRILIDIYPKPSGKLVKITTLDGINIAYSSLLVEKAVKRKHYVSNHKRLPLENKLSSWKGTLYIITYKADQNMFDMLLRYSDGVSEFRQVISGMESEPSIAYHTKDCATSDYIAALTENIKESPSLLSDDNKVYYGPLVNNLVETVPPAPNNLVETVISATLVDNLVETAIHTHGVVAP